MERLDLTVRTTAGVTVLQAGHITAAGGVAHGFSTRQGGVSAPPWNSMNLGVTRGDDPRAVRENYRRFQRAVGCTGRVVRTCQVHGNIVRPVTEADGHPDPCAPEGQCADGLITNCPGVALTVFAADCVPILLYDPVARAVAAVHAGWRGTALGIVDTALAQMAEAYGTRPEGLLAAIGPAISRCCFETDEEVPAAMLQALGDRARPHLRPRSGGKWTVDLKALNTLWLTEAGVPQSNIAVSSACTRCRPDLFWSHRAQGVERGSLAAMIMLCPTGEEGGL